jgi:arylsulfatase A-like enzyme
LDELYRDRLRTLQAVDEMVGDLVQTLRETGALDDTYVFFTSDNGYLLGEHRRADKGMPYEEAIRVPLLARGPGVPAGAVERRPASNIDLAPTFAELAGATPPGFVDGRSLVPLLRGDQATSWRQAVLVEHRDSDEGAGGAGVAAAGIGGIGDEPRNPPFAALRLADRVYVEYATGERELYDLAADPLQLENLANDPARADEVAGDHAWLDSLRGCAAQSCRDAEDAPPHGPG